MGNGRVLAPPVPRATLAGTKAEWALFPTLGEKRETVFLMKL